MSKLKQPLLSLGAQGSIADSITFQRAHKTDFVRKKPIPAQPRTDAQVWLRYRYREACYYWQTLSNAEKNIYRSAAVRYHMTGFAYFMREYLNLFTHAKLFLPMDSIISSYTQDYSGNLNHGLVIGATPGPGLINRALIFDGTNDWLNCGNRPILDFTGDFSFEIAIYLNAVSNNPCLFSRGLHLADGYFAYVDTNRALHFLTEQAAAVQDTVSSNFAVNISQAHWISFIRKANYGYWYVDDMDVTLTQPVTIDPLTNARVFYVGRTDAGAQLMQGALDHLIAWDYALTDTQRRIHYERSQL